MHVLDPAETPLQGGGHDDDGNLGAAFAKLGGYLSAELAGAEMVVEDRDVDLVEELGSLFNSGGGDRAVTVLAEDGPPKVEINGVVVKQQDANTRRADEF